MNILLQINVEANFGSTGRIAEAIGNLATASGWQSYIAYGRKKRESSSQLIAVGNKWDHLRHLLQTRLFDRHGLGSKGATRRFIRQIELLDPTIIHLHNIHGYYLNLELLFQYLTKSGIPVVWTFHDCWPITGHCSHFEHVGCNKWQNECYSCPQLNTYPASWGKDRSRKNHQLKKRLFSNMDNLTLVPVSNWLGTILKKSFFSKFEQRPISNGVDTEIFTPRTKNKIRAKYGLENTFMLLGVASVWSSTKGLSDFLKLSEMLVNNEQIVLIGLSKKQLKSLPKSIIGIERTDSIEQLAQWYATTDIYINPSVEESFGLTTAEAMACGTPVIVYDTTACPEMVSPGVGYVAKKNNIQDLYEQICRVKKIGKQSFSAACRKRALEHYDKNRNFQKYLELYKEKGIFQ